MARWDLQAARLEASAQNSTEFQRNDPLLSSPSRTLRKRSSWILKTKDTSSVSKFRPTSLSSNRASPQRVPCRLVSTSGPLVHLRSVDFPCHLAPTRRLRPSCFHPEATAPSPPKIFPIPSSRVRHLRSTLVILIPAPSSPLLPNLLSSRKLERCCDPACLITRDCVQPTSSCCPSDPRHSERHGTQIPHLFRLRVLPRLVGFSGLVVRRGCRGDLAGVRAIGALQGHYDPVLESQGVPQSCRPTRGTRL